jgi:hypothetical protein
VQVWCDNEPGNYQAAVNRLAVSMRSFEAFMNAHNVPTWWVSHDGAESYNNLADVEAPEIYSPCHLTNGTFYWLSPDARGNDQRLIRYHDENNVEFDINVLEVRDASMRFYEIDSPLQIAATSFWAKLSATIAKNSNYSLLRAYDLEVLEEDFLAFTQNEGNDVDLWRNFCVIVETVLWLRRCQSMDHEGINVQNRNTLIDAAVHFRNLSLINTGGQITNVNHPQLMARSLTTIVDVTNNVRENHPDVQIRLLDFTSHIHYSIHELFYNSNGHQLMSTRRMVNAFDEVIPTNGSFYSRIAFDIFPLQNTILFDVVDPFEPQGNINNDELRTQFHPANLFQNVPQNVINFALEIISQNLNTQGTLFYATPGEEVSEFLQTLANSTR